MTYPPFKSLGYDADFNSKLARDPVYKRLSIFALTKYSCGDAEHVSRSAAARATLCCVRRQYMKTFFERRVRNSFVSCQRVSEQDLAVVLVQEWQANRVRREVVTIVYAHTLPNGNFGGATANVKCCSDDRLTCTRL